MEEDALKSTTILCKYEISVPLKKRDVKMPDDCKKTSEGLHLIYCCIMEIDTRNQAVFNIYLLAMKANYGPARRHYQLVSSIVSRVQ